MDMRRYFKYPAPVFYTLLFFFFLNGQANGLVSSFRICNHQVCGHRIQASFHTLHRGIKAFEVYTDIALIFHKSILAQEEDKENKKDLKRITY